LAGPGAARRPPCQAYSDEGASRKQSGSRRLRFAERRMQAARQLFEA